MKIEVTQKGIRDHRGERMPVGTILTIQGDTIPPSMLNKVRVLVGSPSDEAEPVANVATGPTPDDVAQMDKPTLLALLGDDWDGDKRLGVEKLREAVLELIDAD